MNNKDTKTFIEYHSFDTSKISIGQLKEDSNQNNKSLKMKTAWFNYKDEHNDIVTLKVRTPYILIDAYGLPSKEYVDMSDIRAWAKINVPLNQEIPEVKLFTDKLKEIDDLLDNENFRKNNLGRNYRQFKYIKLIKYPAEKNDDDKDDDKTRQNNYPKHPYVQFKINHNVNTNEILLQIGVISTMDDNKLTCTLAPECGTDKNPKYNLTYDKLKEYLGYMTKVRLILKPGKVWATDKKSDPQYGFKFTITNAGVKLPKLRNTIDNSSFDVFLDNDTVMNYDISNDEIKTDENDNKTSKEYNLLKTNIETANKENEDAVKDKDEDTHENKKNDNIDDDDDDDYDDEYDYIINDDDNDNETIRENKVTDNNEENKNNDIIENNTIDDSKDNTQKEKNIKVEDETDNEKINLKTEKKTKNKKKQ